MNSPSCAVFRAVLVKGRFGISASHIPSTKKVTFHETRKASRSVPLVLLLQAILRIPEYSPPQPHTNPLTPETTSPTSHRVR